MSQHVLIVEDEESLAQVLGEYLTQSGLITHIITDGSQVIEWVKQNPVDLLILDLMLPGKNGLDIYRELRTFTDIPVVMATARIDEIDRLIGLELGADDYICKPYSPREVVVRVKNILRRSTDEIKMVDKILSINESTMQVLVKGKEVSLTRAEFRLLSHFHQHKEQVFSREQLMTQIYSDNRVVTDRTIDSHIKNLRRKIQNVDAEVDCIQSIYGVGYKFAL
ncbi:response regulator [Psychromonas sp. SP041]|jgi:two-component system response regulator BaeR|uniref:response regulator n=1 Tax=Psychromonas sp. SP041 TaxID=1365007 RepID=UPI0003FF2C59|nr:response regulator [Psychromonas sp. SP041]